MSALTRPDYQSDEPSRYAPKWIREGHLRSPEPVTRMPRAAQFEVGEPPAEERSAAWQQDTTFEDRREASFESAREEAPFEDRESPYYKDRRDPTAPRQDAGFEGDIALRQMREAGTFELRKVSDPRWNEKRKFPASMLLRTTAALAIATIGALVYVGVVPLPAGLQNMVPGLKPTAETPVESRAPAIERPTKLAGRLGEAPAAAEPAAAAPANAPAAAAAPADNARAVRTVAVAPWPAAAAPQAAPAPAAPQPNVAVAPATVAAPPSPATPQQATVPQGAAAGLVTRQLDHDEIDALIRRGETFILQGDFAAARLMLKRAAEGGSARAAVTLGATYDPVMLRKVGVVGFKAEPALARDWYERAIALGSAEAAARIAELDKN